MRKIFKGSIFYGVLACLLLLYHSASISAQITNTSDDSKDQIFMHRSYWDSYRTLLIGVGDSLTQGTRDLTNNKTNTKNSYLHKVYKQLNEVISIKFYQPFLNDNEIRLNPFTVPTNLGVDGEDIFSLEGYEYGKRVGSDVNYKTNDYLCDKLQPYLFADMHDKVLFPINLLARKPVSQLDSLIWHINKHRGPVWNIFWVGNNEASTASLGVGGKNPEFLPIPFEQIKTYLKPGLRLLLNFAKNNGIISFEPYTLKNIERNLTTELDFENQFNHVLDRLYNESDLSKTEFFLLTFPYYCEAGYLFNKDDLNFYLNKQNYTVPVSFGNNRVSLFTFCCMFALLKSEEHNKLDEILKKDGLVLSEGERGIIRNRIDSFNSIVNATSGVHIIDTGTFLNYFLENGMIINGTQFTRSWGRGSSFSMDGVHGGYTAHALIANYILEHMNTTLGLNVPLCNISSIMKNDPYIDRDGDGWIKGPDYKASGFTKVLFLFKDLQEDVFGGAIIDTISSEELWDFISNVILEEIIKIPILKLQAQQLNIISKD